MKTIKHLLLCLMTFLPMSSYAHDFEVDGIYYNKNSDGVSAYVTYRGSSYYNYREYSGNVIIPESVTYDGQTYSVTSIGEYAFEGCSSLTSINIPEGVTTIGYYALKGCTALTSLVSNASVPPTCLEGALTDINKNACTLHVSEGTKSLYATADQWKDFVFIEENTSTGIGSIYDDGTGAKVKAIYNMNGQKVSNPIPGNLYIFMYENGEKRKTVFSR